MTNPVFTDQQIAQVIAERCSPPDDGAALHDWVMTFARDLLARAALTSQAEPVPADVIRAALDTPGAERLKEWAGIGPVQRAAVEVFADRLAAIAAKGQA